MPDVVKVLLLEDEPLDALLIKRALSRGSTPVELVHAASREEFLRHLDAGGFHAVISDGSVLGLEGLLAFHLARERALHVPFLFVSGADDPDRDLRGLRGLGVANFLSKSKLEQLATALEKALSGAGDQDEDDMTSIRLADVAEALSSSRALKDVMAIVRCAARELVGADGATFVLREGDRCYYADEDAIGPLWKGQRFPVASCLSGWAMLHRQPAVVEDIFSDRRVPLATYEPTFVRSAVMVPIRALDPIGAIGAYWAQPRVPADREVSLLQTLADATAVAMESLRVREELERRVMESPAELAALSARLRTICARRSGGSTRSPES